MNERDVEQKLYTALEHAAPNDLEGVRARCGPQNGNIVPMPVRRRSLRKVIAPRAAGACVARAAFGGMAGVRYQQAHAVASVVSLDVNPCVRLEVNRAEEVLSATPMDEDARIVMEGMDLTGTDLDVAVNAIVGSLLKHGYVDELANSVLVSVEDADAARGAALEEKLSGEIAQVLEEASINGAILSQSFAGDDQLRQKAEEYGISQGKAVLIQSLVDQSTHLTFESLAGLSINELNLLANSAAAKDKDSQTTAQEPIRSTGTASQGSYIGAEAARQIALTQAGVGESDLEFWSCDYDYEDGRMVYEVELVTAAASYEYDVDAATGEILKMELEERVSPAGPTGPTTESSGQGASGSITWEQARTIALNRAGVTESQAYHVEWESEYENGRQVFKVEFETDAMEYECEVDGATGAVLQFEQEKKTTVPAGTAAITGEEAKAIAFSHAGVTAASVTGLEVELDDGCYQVEFESGRYEYEYEISAADGTILQAERDD